MLRSGKTPFPGKKAFEIAYAIFRASANMPDIGFAGILRGEAIQLLGNAAKGNYIEAAKSITAIEYFIKLAAEATFINFVNTEILIKELGNLNAAIAESSNNPATQEIDLSGIFSNERPKGEQHLFRARKHELNKESKEVPEQEVVDSEIKEDGNGNLKSEMRQSAIMERMRQSGNCRLKDILELFPDSSERTLRYDLQSLIEQNLVERVGSGGPSVFYRVRQVPQTA